MSRDRMAGRHGRIFEAGIDEMGRKQARNERQRSSQILLRGVRVYHAG
jgi:hypothetical protein